MKSHLSAILSLILLVHLVGGGAVNSFILAATRWVRATSAPASAPASAPLTTYAATVLRANAFDRYLESGLADKTHLDEENVREALDELVNSDFGQTMFGQNDQAASAGITGMCDFVEIQGPEVILRLSGAFWHRRETVLGRAAMYLNAKMPEIVDVNVADPTELEDSEDIYDEDTGELLGTRDKRSPDFNGDREVMEYQGRDPDVRGPFPSLFGSGGGGMINPM